MFVEKSLEEFTELLKSNSPTPGGGGVAALNSALGAAQIMMVINHTLGKAEFAEVENELKSDLDELEDLRAELLQGVDEDAKAFGKMAKAFKMPSGNDVEKSARDAAIAEASVMATEAPLRVMKNGLRALEICESLIDKTNTNLASDLKVAALSLEAGIKSARFNVDANLPILRKKDRALADDAEKTATEIICKVKKLTEIAELNF